MNAAEDRAVGRALTLVLAGDRSGAANILRCLRNKKTPTLCDVRQLPMRFLMFRCETLGTDQAIHVCVTRQRITDIQRTNDKERGTVGEYPHCDTRRCTQGRHYREVLDPTQTPWTAASSYTSRARSRPHSKTEQEAARRRLQAVGMLDEVPTLDNPGSPVEPE